MARNPELLTHIEWLGYLQPVGLVVSPPALADAQAFPSKNIIPDHTRFLDLVEQVTLEGRAATLGLRFASSRALPRRSSAGSRRTSSGRRREGLFPIHWR